MTDVAAVEEVVKSLATKRGVIGVLIVNGDGVCIRSTLEQDVTVQYAALTSHLTLQAVNFIRDMAPDDDLQYLRLRSKRYEIMIAPHYEQEQRLALVVIQNPALGEAS